MATQAAAYQRNMESNILFMQTEHAKTLKGLHEEIQSLQKKCSDLTFQLNMQGLGEIDSGMPSSRLDDYEKQVKDKEKEHLELYKDLEKKDKLIKALEMEVKKLKINHQKELRKRTENLDQMRADLESKSNQVAYLTTELHKLKKLQLENATKQTAYLDYRHGLVPAPPKEPVSFNIRRGHFRSRKKQELEEKEREMNPVRVSSGGSSRSDSPTVELARSFIEKPEDVKGPVVQENKHPVLPPIHQRPNTTDYPGNQAGGRPPVIVQHVVPPHNHPKKKVSLSSEVQVIAVDKVSPDSKWATHAHESHSTEYN